MSANKQLEFELALLKAVAEAIADVSDRIIASLRESEESAAEYIRQRLEQAKRER